MKTWVFLPAICILAVSLACSRYGGDGDDGGEPHDGDWESHQADAEESSSPEETDYSSEEHERRCHSGGGAGDCMWDADCLIDDVCTPGCYCMPREGLEDCECTRNDDCETPHHCIMCKCQSDFPWCAMNSCLSDEQCSADGEICTGVGGECVMDDRYDICYCLCNP